MMRFYLISAKYIAASPHFRGKKQGFALIVTLTMMALLTVIAIGLLSLSTVSIRSAKSGEAHATAQANARLALQLALGSLQKLAGPDQRITASASLVDSSGGNIHWTGAWDATDPKGNPTWLVSGNPNADPNPSVKGDTVLHSALDGIDNSEVTVDQVRLEASNREAGSFAWWISDEGSKARVDLGTDPDYTPEKFERLAVSSTPSSAGSPYISDIFADLLPDGGTDPGALVSTKSLELAVADPGNMRKFLHDITTGGYGLPVNVRDGKLKTDLSLVFDSASESRNFTQEYIGAKTSAVRIGGSQLYDFQVNNPQKFYFIDELNRNGNSKIGPNWGILINYAKLATFTRGGNLASFVGIQPKPEGDLRTNDWAPYQNADDGNWKRDTQHTNSGLTPVCSHLQMGFRLKARSGATYRNSAGEVKSDGYQMQLEMKPVIGIWNPYNVKIKAAVYSFDWALYPYLRIGINGPDGRQLAIPRVWMREHWKTGTGGDTPETSGGRWFRLRTPNVDLEPGESRLFSVDEAKSMTSVNDLVAGWNEEGAFSFDLVTSRFESEALAGQPIVVPPGSTSWYGDLFLEDSQHAETQRQFPDGFVNGASASWFTMKSGNDVIHRVSDLWFTPRQGARRAYYIPEQVISDHVRTGSSSPKISVAQLAAAPWHIGTWSWSLRTTTDATQALKPRIGTQTLRNWVDTNPRYVSNNPQWDGSSLSRSGNYDGWYFNSPMVGGSHPGTSYNGHDGSGSAIRPMDGLKGRGLVALGQIGETEPQVSGIRRYQGFGGNSTSANGQTHTAIYDVPRTGLVSIGQFQHAQLSRYGYEPGFAVGNSYASIRIPLDGTIVENYNGVDGFNMTDISWYTNDALWDDFFFSTIGIDYHGSRGSLDTFYNLSELVDGTKHLPNPRYSFSRRPSDSSMSRILDDAGRRAPEAIASRIHIEGAFNVNSTSKSAWKAILSSMADLEFPTIGTSGGATSWSKTGGARIPRFSHVIDPTGWDASSNDTDAYWRSFRKIDDDELDALAEAIVEQVRERGPFRSMASFVNRNPDSSDTAHQVSGPLQAALDKSLNASLPREISLPSEAPSNSNKNFSEANQNHSQALGTTSYAMQGDILQALAPILQVRSDYFRIRTMGVATDASGKVLARARCEAFVQRIPDYIDPSEAPEIRADDLTEPANIKFGRRFEIVSFRWLADSEA